jgi:hypothetical protein
MFWIEQSITELKEDLIIAKCSLGLFGVGILVVTIQEYILRLYTNIQKNLSYIN